MVSFPYCNFTARKLCPVDDKIWKYICNRCSSVFVPYMRPED